MIIKNIIFDFGGVLVDWNPRYLFGDHFQNSDEMEYFLTHVCNEEWNLEQDKGRKFTDGVRLLQAKHPNFSSQIALYHQHWEKMLGDQIQGSVDLLLELKKTYKIYGLTNWSSETIDFALEKFRFFKYMDSIVVSGREELIKPDPRIYRLLLDRFSILAKESVFIDDNKANVSSAREIGFHAIHFTNPSELAVELREIGIYI